MSDNIEKINNTVIQHGKDNDRIYLMKLDKNDYNNNIIDELENIAIKGDYSKIFAKVPSWAEQKFLDAGYIKEAYIPNFYNNSTDVYFMSKYLKSWRESCDDELIEKVINKSKKKHREENNVEYDESKFFLRILSKDDAQSMTKVYKAVFETYPFPIHDADYLKETMDDNFIYFGIFEGEKLCGISSCEIDFEYKNVEMTDFAVLHEYRGLNFASVLLNEMEKEMISRDITTFYTIARAVSFGMNITFSKNGYKYTGTLINNTNISGQLESMNIWYKHTSSA